MVVKLVDIATRSDPVLDSVASTSASGATSAPVQDAALPTKGAQTFDTPPPHSPPYPPPHAPPTLSVNEMACCVSHVRCVVSMQSSA
jgi:hypothetical protein